MEDLNKNPQQLLLYFTGGFYYVEHPMILFFLFFFPFLFSKCSTSHLPFPLASLSPYCIVLHRLNGGDSNTRLLDKRHGHNPHSVPHRLLVLRNMEAVWFSSLMVKWKWSRCQAKRVFLVAYRNISFIFSKWKSGNREQTPANVTWKMTIVYSVWWIYDKKKQHGEFAWINCMPFWRQLQNIYGSKIILQLLSVNWTIQKYHRQISN